MDNNKIYGIGIFALLLSFVLDEFIWIPRHAAVDYVFQSVFNFLTLTVLFFAVAIVFLYKDQKARAIMPLLFSGAATIIITVAIKLAVMRVRPDATGIIGGVFFMYSFPSLHAAFAFSALPMLNQKFRKVKWFWIVFAVTIAFSRLYFNVHYLSDVIAGGLLGYFIGDIILKLSEKK